MGNPTCYKYNGLSSVDYGLASPSLYERISTFCVRNPVISISDHFPISVTINTNVWCTEEPVKCKILPKPEKVRWDKNNSTHFELLLQTPECKQSVKTFLESEIVHTTEGIEKAVNFLTDTMVSKAEAANISVKRSKPPSNRGKRKRKVNHPKWHDATCQEALRKLNATSALLKKYPQNPWPRGKVNTERKHYKSLVKKPKRIF